MIRKVSKKRAEQNNEYTKIRKWERKPTYPEGWVG
jgi:hypothetical protein